MSRFVRHGVRADPRHYFQGAVLEHEETQALPVVEGVELLGALDLWVLEFLAELELPAGARPPCQVAVQALPHLHGRAGRLAALPEKEFFAVEGVRLFRHGIEQSKARPVCRAI